MYSCSSLSPPATTLHPQQSRRRLVVILHSWKAASSYRATRRCSQGSSGSAVIVAQVERISPISADKDANAQFWGILRNYYPTIALMPWWLQIVAVAAGGCGMFVLYVWDAAGIRFIHEDFRASLWSACCHFNNRPLMTARRGRWHYSRQHPGGHYIWMEEVWKQRRAAGEEEEWMDVRGLALPSVSVTF